MLLKLIEDCGDSFCDLIKHVDGSGFTARGTTAPKTTCVLVDVFAFGETPKEAVQELINKLKPSSPFTPPQPNPSEDLAV